MNAVAFWLLRPLCVMLIIGVLLSALRLLTARKYEQSAFPVTREVEAAHLFMNGSMVLMLAPWFGGMWVSIVGGLYATTTLCFAVLFALKLKFPPRQNAADQRVTYAYHFAVGLIMLYALYSMQASPTMMGMATMPMKPRLTVRIIAGFFLLDAGATAVVGLFFPQLIYQNIDGQGVSTPIVGRLALAPHIIMDIGMAVMLGIV